MQKNILNLLLSLALAGPILSVNPLQLLSGISAVNLEKYLPIRDLASLTATSRESRKMSTLPRTNRRIDALSRTSAFIRFFHSLGEYNRVVTRSDYLYVLQCTDAYKIPSSDFLIGVSRVALHHMNDGLALDCRNALKAGNVFMMQSIQLSDLARGIVAALNSLDVVPGDAYGAGQIPSYTLPSRTKIIQELDRILKLSPLELFNRRCEAREVYLYNPIWNCNQYWQPSNDEAMHVYTDFEQVGRIILRPHLPSTDQVIPSDYDPCFIGLPRIELLPQGDRTLLRYFDESKPPLELLLPAINTTITFPPHIADWLRRGARYA